MKTIIKMLFVAVAMLALHAGTASAQLLDKKALSLEAARKISAAAEAEAAKNKWTVVIAIVDEGGHLISLSRIDGTQTGSVDVAIKKARTAAGFKRASKVFEDAIAGGRNAILGLDNALGLEGGLPLIYNGQIIGAIGVSGVTSQQDGVVAKAGADALLAMQ